VGVRSGGAVRAAGPRWVRGFGRVAAGWVELDTRRPVEEYVPISEPDLVFDLADIRRPQDAVRFVRRYGLLWHGPGADTFRERFSEWEETAQTLRGILWYAATLRDALSGAPVAQEELRRRAADLTDLFQAPAASLDELYAQVSVVIARAVSEGLQGVEEGLEAAVEWETAPGSGIAGPPGQFVFSAHAPHLVGYAYHQLALLLVQRVPLGTCEGCGRFFRVEHGRQRYCSPRCAGRVRWRRWATRRTGRQEPQEPQEPQEQAQERQQEQEG
jgi:hypothetical protein